MKKAMRYVTLLCLVVAGSVLAGCSSDETTPDLVIPQGGGIDNTQTTPTSCVINLEVPGMAEVAWLLDSGTPEVKAEQTEGLTPEQVYAQGTKVAVPASGKVSISVTGLKNNADNKVLFVGAWKDSSNQTHLTEVKSVNVTTPQFDLVATLVEDKITYSSATFDVATQNGVNKVFWQVNGEASDATMLVAEATESGRTIDIEAGAGQVVVSGLNAESENVVYLVGAYEGGEKLTEVFSYTVTTPSFGEELTVFDVTRNSFSAHLKVNDRVKAGNTVLKWGTSSVFIYNMNVGENPSWTSLVTHDRYYPGFIIRGDTTLVVDPEHAVNGVDEMGDPIEYYYPLFPGQPNYFMYGEFEYGENPLMDFGDGPGYYVPLFRMEDYMNSYDPWSGEPAPDENEYWTGQHGKTLVMAEQPRSFDPSLLGLTVECTPKEIVLKYNPDPAIAAYSVMLLDDETYQMVLQCLEGKEEYLQWFATSYDALMTLPVQIYEGPSEVHASEAVWLVPDVEYHVLTVGTTNFETLEEQCFVHMAGLKLSEPKYPAPKVQISPVANAENLDASEWVTFNIKKDPTSETDIEELYYAAENAHEWVPMESRYGLQQLLQNYGNLIPAGKDAEGIDVYAAINSDKGYNLVFNTREDTELYCGIYGKNFEGTASEAVVSSTRTAAKPLPTPVASDLYTQLEGDWTATATISYQVYETTPDNPLGSYVPKTEEVKAKVTIGEVGYPATLPQSVYDLYASVVGKTKEEVDAFYEVFKGSVDRFNVKTHAYSRVLCQGFDLAKKDAYSGKSGLEYESPYDLFISETYNGYGPEAMAWDFGPKWYIQINEDGSIGVPVNANEFSPMKYVDGQYHLVGVDANNTGALPYTTDVEGNPVTYFFPAELSDNNNTITIKPYVYNGAEYYPCAGQYYYGNFNFSSKVVSNIVMTRGWEEPAVEASAPAKAKAGRRSAIRIDAKNLKTAVRPYSITPLKGKAVVNYKQYEYKGVTKAEFREKARKYARQMR